MWTDNTPWLWSFPLNLHLVLCPRASTTQLWNKIKPKMDSTPARSPTVPTSAAIMDLVKAVDNYRMHPDESLRKLEQLPKPWPIPRKSAEVKFFEELFNTIKCEEFGGRRSDLLMLLPVLAAWLDGVLDWSDGRCMHTHPQEWWPLALARGAHRQKQAFAALPIGLLEKSATLVREHDGLEMVSRPDCSPSGVDLVNHADCGVSGASRVATIGLWPHVPVPQFRAMLDRGMRPPLLWVATRMSVQRGTYRLTQLTENLAQVGDDGERAFLCASLTLAPLLLHSEHKLPVSLVNLVTDYMVGEDTARHRQLRLQVALTIWARRVYPDTNLRFANWEQCWGCRRPGFALLRCGRCGVPSFCNQQCQKQHWSKGGGWNSSSHKDHCAHLQRDPHMNQLELWSSFLYLQLDPR